MTSYGVSEDPQSGAKALTLVGMGCIGSYLVPQLARLPGVGRITLIDDACYDNPIRTAEDILPNELGKPKVEVQARRARRINPDLHVEAVCAPVDAAPLGRFRGNVILADVHSQVARQRVNRAAWRLGMPWIQGGVDPRGPVVWVTAFVPRPDAPCLECGWDEAGYASRGQTWPIREKGSGTAAGRTAAGAVAVAAGLMAAECLKLLTGGWQDLGRGRSVVMDLEHGTLQMTHFRPRSECPFDHDTWKIEPVTQSPTKLTIAQAIRAAARERGLCRGWDLRLEGLTFAERQYCAGCRTATSDSIHVARRIPPARKGCPTCGGQMVVRGSDAVEALALARLTKHERRRTLHSMGFRHGDVYSVSGPGGVRHFELTAPRRPIITPRDDDDEGVRVID